MNLKRDAQILLSEEEEYTEDELDLSLTMGGNALWLLVEILDDNISSFDVPGEYSAFKKSVQQMITNYPCLTGQEPTKPITEPDAAKAKEKTNA